MVGRAQILERKLGSTKVRLFTVPCYSIILFSSEGKRIITYSYFFIVLYINLVCSIIVFSHIYQFRSIFFRSIINFASTVL